jgi:hypothetical protein
MARPTKRKTKHRGNAAGMIEVKGVTHARSSATGGRAGSGRVDPRMREPSWKSAFIRALFAAGVFAIVMSVALGGKPLSVLLTAVFLVVIYTPFGFYFDRFMYDRRMRKLAGPSTPPAPKAPRAPKSKG